MKKITFIFLNKIFGKKKYQRFFLILKNIALQGLNYRETDLSINGEHYFIKKVANFYKKKPKTTIIFDVGANVGNYSIALKKAFTNNYHIYAFEPFSSPFKVLSQLTDKNLSTIKMGLSNKVEKLNVFSSDDNSEVGGVYNRDYVLGEILHDKVEENNFTTIDLFCKDNKIDYINFLKIDVEGHELAVLEGTNSLFNSGNVDIIQFEFGAGNQYAKTYLIDFFNLLSKKYKIYKLLRDGLDEIKSYSPDYEILLLTNFICVKNEIVSSFVNEK